MITEEDIKEGLATKFLGHKVYCFEEVSSTNDFALRLARDGAPEGTLVLARSQSGGRGRLGREWCSPPGGLWASVILRPIITPAQAPQLTLLTGTAVARTINCITGLDALIKWPNDILVNGKKVGGILTEMATSPDGINYVVVGIGVNLDVDLNEFPWAFRDATASLNKEAGHQVSMVGFLHQMLKEIEALYLVLKEKGFEPILDEWRRLSATLGRRVKALGQDRIVKGQAVDVDSAGALIIRTGEGKIERVLAGDVTILR